TDMRPFEHTPLARVKALSWMAPTQPLFETLLVFESYRLDSVMLSLGGLWKSRKVELHELTNLPITLAAYDGEELSFKIEFDRRRLDDAVIDRMLGHLRRLMEGIAAKASTTVSEIPLITENERLSLIRINEPEKAPKSRHIPDDGGATLSALFEAQAARQPEAVALTCDGQSLTYAQLNSRANQLARRLVQLGVKVDT